MERKNIINSIYFGFILFSFIFLAFGSDSDEKKVNNVEKPFEMRSYDLSASTKEHSTTIQFTEKNKLWICNTNNGINCNVTDGSWEYVDQKNNIVRITMASGGNQHYEGVYKYNDSIRQLYRVIDNDTTFFYGDYDE